MTEGIPSYDELKLRIARGAEGTYQVVAFGPDGSTASGTFSLPFDETQLDNFVLRVGRPRRGVRAYRSSQMEDAKRFGSQLFDALISGAVHDVYLGARRVAEQNDRGLRVTLYLTDVPDLMEVPWEFLYDRPAFLSQSIYTPVVRSLDLKTVRPPRKLTLPLRILGIVSCPRGFDTLEVAREQSKLAEALGPLEREGMVELRWLEEATMSALDDAISAPEDVHVVHYIGHGAYDKRTEGGILVLEDADAGPHEVTGEELGSLLQDERSLRLVVLNACEGARASHVDPFSGVASSLVECGIPAVVGMQFEITDEAAITFAGRLYKALVQGFPIDAALAQSRKAIFAAGNDIEFGTPVLFLRAGDARLFNPEEYTGHPVPGAAPTEVGGAVAGAKLDSVTTDAADDEHTYERDALATEPAASTVAPTPGRVEPDSAGTAEPESVATPHGRPSIGRPRRSILLLPLAAVVVALAALLISQSGSRHNTPAASAGATSGGVLSDWQTLPPLPNPVIAPGVAAYRGKIWVVGGTRGEIHDPVTDVYAYDPHGHRWLTASQGIPQLPDARAHAALVATKNPDHLYLIGGNGLDGSKPRDNSARHPVETTVFRLDSGSTTWKQDEHPLLSRRESGAAAFDGARIVFAGGNDEPGSVKADIWARAPDGQWTTIGSLHQPRDHLAAASDGTGTVWFVGGAPASTAVDRVKDKTVNPGPSVDISHTAAVALGPGFCTIGGSEGNTGNRLTAATQCHLTSYSIPRLATPTADLAAARLDDTVYVVGGYSSSSPFGVTTAEALHIPPTP